LYLFIDLGIIWLFPKRLSFSQITTQAPTRLLGPRDIPSRLSWGPWLLKGPERDPRGLLWTRMHRDRRPIRILLVKLLFYHFSRRL